jgi:transcriptional antiterminator RfaH
MHQWFALRTHPKREVQVSTVLAHRGVEVYFPQVSGWRRPGRREASLEALFPGYLFSRLDVASDQWIAARSAPGVAYFLGTPSEPIAIPDGLISAIRQRADAQSRQRQQPSFKAGDRVLIQSGPFDGLEAVFDGTLNGAGRVRVLLSLVNRLTPLELTLDYLRPAG